MKQSSIVRDIGRLYVIDSSTMSMSISQHPWATFRKTKAGVKLHLRVVVTKDLTIPDQAVLLPAKHADRSQMNGLIEIDPDAFYLFDRGYWITNNSITIVLMAFALLHDSRRALK